MSEATFNNGSANSESANSPQVAEVLANNVTHDVVTPSGGSQEAGIEARNITVTYRNGHTALRDASFSIPNTTICALVGVNGSGKSTLFKAIMGFVPLASGSVNICLLYTSPSPRDRG